MEITNFVVPIRRINTNESGVERLEIIPKGFLRNGLRMGDGK